MATVYKLTTQENTTHEGCLWIPGEWKMTNGKGPLCTPGWLHAYSDPLVASFMNPAHANIVNPKLWEAEAEGKFQDDHGLKCGYASMRIVKEIPLPTISVGKKIEIAIHCAIIAGYDNGDFVAWALHWINGDDRTAAATETTLAAVETKRAWSAAAMAAEWPAFAAARAALNAVGDTYYATATAEEAAFAAAMAAEWSAAARAAAGSEFSLASLIREILDTKRSER